MTRSTPRASPARNMGATAIARTPARRQVVGVDPGVRLGVPAQERHADADAESGKALSPAVRDPSGLVCKPLTARWTMTFLSAMMFDHRGVRTLPRLVGQGGVVDDDTLMLYDYLKEHNGICASHTSATGMGTDWRDVNPKFEPIVEIYQGHRQSYEYLGAPRGARGGASRSAAGSRWAWSGTPWPCNTGSASRRRAITSRPTSATRSPWPRTRTRAGDPRRLPPPALLRRHRQYHHGRPLGRPPDGRRIRLPMGPSSSRCSSAAPRPVARVDIIKDFRYVYSTEPKNEQVEFEWTDDEQGRPAGLSWYYVRAIQDRRRARLGQPDLGAPPPYPR